MKKRSNKELFKEELELFNNLRLKVRAVLLKNIMEMAQKYNLGVERKKKK